MSTTSLIGYVFPNGKIRAIYCHQDGYPSYQLVMLNANYNSAKAAIEITDLGALSVLKPWLYPSSANHSFNNPESQVTIAYHRDRGEDLDIREYNNFTEMCERIGACMDYVYLWEDDSWKCWKRVEGKYTPYTIY